MSRGERKKDASSHVCERHLGSFEVFSDFLLVKLDRKLFLG